MHSYAIHPHHRLSILHFSGEVGVDEIIDCLKDLYASQLPDHMSDGTIRL